LIADTESRPTYTNAAFQKLFGFDGSFDIKDLKLDQMIADQDELDDLLNGLAKRKWSGTLDIQKADGSTQEVHLMARVLSDESFTPSAQIFMFADSADSAIAFLDLDGKITYVDDTFMKLWLLADEQEVLGRSFETLWQQRETARNTLQLWQRGEGWSGQLTAIRSDESSRDVHIITRPVSNENNLPVSSVITCFDITERKILEAEASRLIKELGGGTNLEYFIGKRKPIQNVGINFGAPGDRRAENGTLWLEWPSNRGPSPAVKLELIPEDAKFFTHDPTWIKGNGPRWIGASGVSGVNGITLWLTDETFAQASNQERLYNVSLYFTEPEDSNPGERQFDIRIQGQIVSKGFDPIQESKSSRDIIVKSFEGISVLDKLEIELVPNQNSGGKEPVICGIEINIQETTSSG